MPSRRPRQRYTEGETLVLVVLPALGHRQVVAVYVSEYQPVLLQESSMSNYPTQVHLSPAGNHPLEIK
jgi:hypothetical protein